MIFDTHAHYDDEKFDEDRESLLLSLPSNGIESIVNIGSSIESLYATIALTKNYSWIYGAIGIHPNETGDLDEKTFEDIVNLAKKPKVVAIGEIGLDYYWDEPDREIQKNWFVRQLNLARELKLPVVIHSRDAAEDTLTILKEQKAGEIGGIIHCFSYGVEMAKEYLDMGFYIGVGGVVTFNNSKKLKEVVKSVPLDRIVLETDAPYLSPEPNRGKRNTSINLHYVVNEIARLKDVTPEEVIEVTTRNAKTVYGLI